MIIASIFSSIEFYVIAVMVAAAVVGFFARPHRRSEARQYLLPSTLSNEPDTTGQSIEIKVLDDGTVRLIRHGVPDLTEAGAVSIAVEVAGFDIEVKERIVRSTEPAWGANTATFVLDFLAPERYHLHYVNPDLDIMAVTTLHVRPGIHITKPLA